MEDDDRGPPLRAAAASRVGLWEVRYEGTRSRTDPSDALLIKLYCTQLLHALGRRVHLRQQAMSTAVVLFRRFCWQQSVFDRDLVLCSITSLWAASKVEECAVSPKVLVWELCELGEVSYEVQELVYAEFLLLSELHFDILVCHPHRPLAHLLQHVSAAASLAPDKRERLAGTAWYLLNDCFRTDACLCHPPVAIALACLHTAGKLLGVSTYCWFPRPPLEEQRHIQQTANAIVVLYEQCAELEPWESTAAQEARRRRERDMGL